MAASDGSKKVQFVVDVFEAVKDSNYDVMAAPVFAPRGPQLPPLVQSSDALHLCAVLEVPEKYRGPIALRPPISREWAIKSEALASSCLNEVKAVCVDKYKMDKAKVKCTVLFNDNAGTGIIEIAKVEKPDLIILSMPVKKKKGKSLMKSLSAVMYPTPFVGEPAKLSPTRIAEETQCTVQTIVQGKLGEEDKSGAKKAGGKSNPFLRRAFSNP